MPEITINISGGNNQILPNATHAEQHFHYHGVEAPPAIESKSRETANDEDRQRLSLYINKEEDLDKYLSLLRTCRTAAEVGEVVATMCENEPQVDSERIVKGSFIKLLLPFLTHVTKGKGIDNLRCCINEAWASRRKALRNIK